MNYLSMPSEDGVLNLGLAIGNSGGEAIGQHYGIPSELIDFTTDPNVATYFACLNSNPEADDTASVFGIFYERALQNGLEVILPPPYAERIYLQRGLFLRSSGPLDRQALRIVETRFPTRLTFSDRRFEPFAVTRADDQAVDILADNTGLSGLVAECQTDKIRDKSQFIQDWVAKLSVILRNRYPHPLLMWAGFLENFRETLDALAMVIVGDQHGLDQSRTRHIVTSNKIEAAEMAKVAFVVADKGLRQFPELRDDWVKMVRIGQIINEILGDIGKSAD
jgi:hypothetical protein